MINTQTEARNFSPSILLVDDDRLILSTLSSGLKRAGYQVSTAESVDEAESWLNNNVVDLVILDMRMPNREGLELTAQLDELEVPFILLTAYTELDIIQRVISTGAMGYLVKPVDVSQLIPAIETALKRSHEIYGLRNEKQQLQTALNGDRAISVAVGIMMDQHKVNHDEALKLIRDLARSKHIKLADLASNIVDSREMLNLKIDA